MPPKSRKSLTFWQKCEDCSCILSVKDTANHESYCALPRTDWPCGYILGKELYGILEDSKGKDLSKTHIGGHEKDVVLLSQSGMQLCGFAIGFPVVVEVDAIKTILKAWPTSEGSLTSVFVCKEELEYLSGSKLETSRIKISQLPEKPYFASAIHYKFLVPEETLPNLEQLTSSFQVRLKNKVVYNGMIIIIPFYGKKTRLQLTDISGDIPDLTLGDDLSSHLEKIRLNNSYYLTNEKTNWINESNTLGKKEKLVAQKKKISGYKSLLSELEQNIAYTFSSKTEGISSYSLLLYGITGSGKTSIAEYLAEKSNKECITVQGSELFSKYYGETEKSLRSYFEEAIRKAPCVILLDKIEILGSRKGSDQERRVLSCLLSMFDSIKNLPVVVIATTTDPDLLDPALRRPGRLETEVEVSIPNEKDRYDILKTLVSGDEELEGVIMELAAACHGYVAADLSALALKAITSSTLRGASSIAEEDLRAAFSQVRPSAMRQLQVHVPSVRWSDIGGGGEVRLKLEQAVEWPLRYADSLKRLGIKPPRGVLLYGPPGCSKTLLVKALATETNLNFISIKGSDVFSKWVGESEKAIREIFRSARKVAPAIVFIDEADALGASRGSSTGGSGVSERVLSQLLTEMDGVNPLEGVVIIAATNRPDCIDKALLRPGRLDRIIYVPLPDHKTRLQIFEIQMKKIPTSDVNIQELVLKTEGYSGAEVVAVCTEAALAALQEDMSATRVRMQHFQSALVTVTPRTPQSLLKLYAEYSQKGGT